METSIPHPNPTKNNDYDNDKEIAELAYRIHSWIHSVNLKM